MDSIYSLVTKKNALFLARLSLFIVYAWFGALKLLGVSPVASFIDELNMAMIGMSPGFFHPVLGLFEIIVGVGFLFPRYIKLVAALVVLHLVTTFLPFIYLSDQVWDKPLVLSFIGEFIVKNLVLLTLTLVLLSQRSKTSRG